MDKFLLLQRLSLVHAQAEAAHLETVMSSQLVTQLENDGRDPSAAKLQLRTWEMTEQKLLRELDWILDKLDRDAPAEGP
ncbi:MAG: hypothetical protein AB7F09_24190 [Parvibaculaceae bacterium]